MTEIDQRTEGRRSRRDRIAHRIVRLRRDARSYRRRLTALALLALAGFGLAAYLALAGIDDGAGDDDGAASYLGRGVAGVQEPYDPDATPRGEAVELPEGLEPPAPLPEEAAAAAPSARPLDGGSASYYHDALEGRPTASGEPYRATELTAAHRSLPFGSRVRVTNLANGSSVVVRVNDRGPFAANRVIDLSRTAASRIGLLRRGHGKVRLELLK